jgi:diketogulonate reductase-like aldo/keto reductase
MRTFSKLPSLFYGTAWKKERTAELVERAILYGFQGIDTACQPKHYHEAGVGHALLRIKQRREALFIQTKFTPVSGQDPATIPYDPFAPIRDQVVQSVQTSLSNLNTDYLDALLLHSPLPTHAQTLEAWEALEELHQQGIIHRLGISNCYELHELKLIFNDVAIKPSVLQNRFYAQTGYDEEIRGWCREKNIHYQGFWTLTANQHLLNHPVLQHLASLHRVTVEQLFYRFLTQQQIIPLIGTCSDRHMQEDLAIFNFAFADDEIRQIHALLG